MDMITPESLPELMTPSEVAQLFRVDPKTVTRWAKMGKLPSLRTMGGHRRYPRADVVRLFNSTYVPERAADEPTKS